MKKLDFENIKVLSPGEQIKKRIIEGFGDIDSFAKKINMEEQTVNKYLQKKRLGSKLFKTKLCEFFLADIDELVISEKDQIKSMVQNISDNLKLYKGNKDIHILSALKIVCIDYNLKEQALIMQRNIAMHYFDIGIADRAIDIIESAINLTKNIELLIKWKSELGLMYTYQCDYKKSRKLYEEIEKLLNKINKIDKKTMFLYYYRYGILENNTDNYFNAESLFLKSLVYAKTSEEIGNATTNIGLSFKLRQDYERAVKYYNKALEIFQDNSNKSRVFNNLAELYKSIKKYDKALYNIKLAFDHIDNGNMSKYFICYQTYAQIQIIRGEYEEVVEKLYDTIIAMEDSFVHRQIIIEGIRTLIGHCNKTHNTNMLNHIRGFLIRLIKKTPKKHDKYLNDLYGFIGEIGLYVM